MHQHAQPGQAASAESFPTDPSGLPEATRPALLELSDGEDFHLRIGLVAKRLGDTTVRMLGYNGSIPGPTLKVRQGTEVTVHVANDGDLEATVHWHGLRLENKYDGLVLQVQRTGLVKEHVDHGPLRGRQDHLRDELLVLDPAAVAADELHPAAGQGHVDNWSSYHDEKADHSWRLYRAAYQRNRQGQG